MMFAILRQGISQNSLKKIERRKTERRKKEKKTQFMIMANYQDFSPK